MSRIELISSMGSVKTFRKQGTVGLSELLYCFHCISEASPRTKSYRLSWGLFESDLLIPCPDSLDRDPSSW